MDEKVAQIQARLRRVLSQPMATPAELAAYRLVGFEVVSGVPTGAENLVPQVIAELKRRGHTVGHIMRYGINTVPEAYRTTPEQRAQGSDAMLVVTPEATTLTRMVAAEPSLVELADAVGPCDIVVCEGFDYQPIPRIIITRKVQEAFNRGLPCIVAYVACQDTEAAIPRFSPLDIDGIVDKIERDIMKIEPAHIAREVEEEPADEAGGAAAAGGSAVAAEGVEVAADGSAVAAASEAAS